MLTRRQVFISVLSPDRDVRQHPAPATGNAASGSPSVEISPRRLETLRVITITQAVNTDTAIARRGMDETFVAEIDADVGKRAVQGIEKDQITGAQQLALDGTAVAGNVSGAALNGQAGGSIIDVTDHAAAIQPGFRILAAKPVTGANQAKRIKRDFITLLADRQWCLRYSSV
jgi:hypothetical protein